MVGEVIKNFLSYLSQPVWSPAWTKDTVTVAQAILNDNRKQDWSVGKVEALDWIWDHGLITMCTEMVT